MTKTLGIPVALAAVLSVLPAPGIAATAAAQEGVLKRATNAAKGTALGRAVTGIETKVQMIDATEVPLDSHNLPQVPVGAVLFGVSGVDIKNGEGVRVKAYLHNPGAQQAVVPVPPEDLFILVDSKGRKIDRISGVNVSGQDDDVPTITIPALERVSISILFGKGLPDAPTATLKVGALGIVGPVPVHTTGVTAPGQQGNVWTPPGGGQQYPE